MTYALKNQPDLWPKQPEGIVGLSVCSLTGKLPGDNCPTRFEYFVKGTQPKDTESLKRNIQVEKDTSREISLVQDPNGPQIPPDRIETKEKQVVSDWFTPEFC